MSLLTDFQSAGFVAARSIMGAVSVAIGGGRVITGVKGERETSRDYELGGFNAQDSDSVVLLLSEFAAAYTSSPKSYHGKAAVVDGVTYRVESITVRDPQLIIRFTSAKDSA